MSVIYVPRLIESTEQAEALPPRTPIIIGPFVAFRAFMDQGWLVTLAEEEYRTEELLAAYSHYGPTALVPVEAEEIHSEDYGTHHLLEAWTSTHPITAYFPKETQ